MKPATVKRYRALEEANPDVGAMVDDLELPQVPESSSMDFGEGLDLTDVKAPPPEVYAPPRLPEYDETADRATIAKGAASDRQDDIARTLFQGGRQFSADLLGGNVTPTSVAAGTAEAKAASAADKRKADAKQRRIESLRALEIGLKAAPKPPDPLATKRVEVLESETERRKAKDALDAKLIEERIRKMRTPKPAAPTPAPDRVPVADMVLSFQGDPSTPREVRLVGAKAVREKSSQWGTALAGLSALKSALTEFVRSPTPANRSKLYGPALSAAGATNAGIGQGAMSADEKAAQYQALGVNVGDLPGIQAMVERAFGDPTGAARDMVARVTAMENLAKETVRAAGQPYGYLPEAPRNQTPDGKVSVRSKATGNIVRVSKSLAEKMLKEGTGEAAQ